MCVSASKAMKQKSNKFLTVLALFALMGATTGCVTSTYDDAQTPGMTDPFEEINRSVFKFNTFIDHNLINPAVDGYRTVVPSPARKGIDNALNNLQSPVHFTNQVLQGDIEGAGDVLFAAIVNTFVGFGGLIDIAEYEGYEHENEDFGQTLATWGVSHGPYVVIPFMGPSTMRDGSGFFIDSFADPLRWYSYNIEEKHIYYNKAGAAYANARNNLKDALTELEASSIDYYASVRSSYYQSREAQVKDKDSSDLASQDTVDFPEYDDF